MRIAILSGAFPPQFDGIGDYTWWLSQELVNQNQEVTVFTSFAPTRPKPASVEVICCFDPAQPRSIQELPRVLHQAGRFDWLIVQYNPFSYGPRGFSPWLIPALHRANIPVAMMFHETYVPFWPWRYSLMRTWQYPQFVRLVRLASAHFVSTQRWVSQVNRWTKRPCRVLPVGSNLPRCGLSKPEARIKLGISQNALLVGVCGFAHSSKCLDWVVEAARSIYDQFPETMILAVGQIGSAIRNACNDVPVLESGRLASAEAALRLRAMDVFLAPFLDGISPRRGSAIAALQHGIPTCSTFSELALAQTTRDGTSVAKDLVELYETHFDWPVIARRMVEDLGLRYPAATGPKSVRHSG